jgi:hypothetical protein
LKLTHVSEREGLMISGAFIRSAYFVSLISLLNLIYVSSAFAESSGWRVLVLDCETTINRNIPVEIIQTVADHSGNWKTLYCDGHSSKVFNAPVFSDGTKLWWLKRKKIEKRIPCTNGYFSYKAVQMLAVSFTDNKTVLLAGESPKEMSETLRDFKESQMMVEDQSGTFSHNQIRLLGMFEDKLAFEYGREEYGCGAAHTAACSHWEVCKFRHGKVTKSKFRIANSAVQSALKHHDKFSESQAFARPDENWSEPILIPSRRYADVEFLCVYNTAPARYHELKIRVPHPEHGETVHQIRKCMKIYPAAKFLSVSPDSRCIVYELKGQLFWKELDSGKSIAMGGVRNIRGVQWLPRISSNHGDSR